MSVCSAHREVVDGCSACHSTPAQVLGITEEEWDRKTAEAEAAGVASCVRCGFEQYKNHYICMVCNLSAWWSERSQP